MSKNHDFILRQKQLKQYLDTVIPQVYSAFCIVLKRYEFEDDEIEKIFYDTQELWTEASNNGTNIVQYAYDLTGILTVSIKQAKQYGIDIPDNVQKMMDEGLI